MKEAQNKDVQDLSGYMLFHDAMEYLDVSAAQLRKLTSRQKRLETLRAVGGVLVKKKDVEEYARKRRTPSTGRPIKTYACPYCKKKIPKYRAYHEHIPRCEKNPNRRKREACPKCGEEFAIGTPLTKHVEACEAERAAA